MLFIIRIIIFYINDIKHPNAETSENTNIKLYRILLEEVVVLAEDGTAWELGADAAPDNVKDVVTEEAGMGVDGPAWEKAAESPDWVE